MRIEEYFYPTINWKPYGDEYKDYPITDYAEIELIPDNDDIVLLENLDRYASRAMFSDEELKDLDDINNDAYEHIICYVHFKKGTYEVDRTPICVITAYDSNEIDIWNNLNDDIKNKIIECGKESLEIWRNTDKIIDDNNI